MTDIEFERVSKRYGDGTLAVENLNLRIADGEFMVLVGPSGCGKTTAFEWSPASNRSPREAFASEASWPIVGSS